MTGLMKAALCAAAAVWAMPANAAVYTYTFYATGEGLKSEGGVTNPLSFNDITLTIALNLAPGGQTAGGGADSGSIIFAGAGLNGFSFSNNTSTSFTQFAGSGLVVFDNPTALLPTSPVAINAASSVLDFRQSSPGGRGLSFRGNINAFTVTEGGISGQIAAVVPEPSTWALMLAGFGLVGYAMRKRRPTVVYA